MKKRNHHPAVTTRRQALLALLGTALLPACGGGTDIAGVSSGGTGSFTTGSIIGLGSVIVNGIRYKDDNAAISINGLPGSPADLKLGMVVRIQGSAITAATATSLAMAEATSVSCSSEWKGRVGAVDPAAKTFTLLGLKVHVLDTTIFEGGLFSGALDGDDVEVYGFSFTDPATGDLALRATRVEVQDQALSSYRLSGVVSHLSSGQYTFQLGNTIIDYEKASGTNGLQNGQLVRVDLQTATNASGHWVATEVRAENTSSELEDEHEAEIEGTVTSAITAEKTFSVSGIPVDASRVSNLPSLSLGTRVEVKGSILNGTVIATEVEVEDDEDIEAQEYEFHGTVSGLTPNSFVVRGYTVQYNGTTRLEPSNTTLADGLRVEVKAKLQPNGDLLATKVEVDH
jgi:Domain of unknown function (DUF5666)